MAVDAHPNPFNSATTVVLRVARSGQLRAAVYSVRGKKVRDLLDATLPAGPREIVWDGCDAHGRRVGSGVYFVRVECAGGSAQCPLVLVK